MIQFVTIKHDPQKNIKNTPPKFWGECVFYSKVHDESRD